MLVLNWYVEQLDTSSAQLLYVVSISGEVFPCLPQRQHLSKHGFESTLNAFSRPLLPCHHHYFSHHHELIMIRSDDEMCFAWVAAPRLDQHHQQRHSGKQKSFHRHFHFFVSIIIIFSTRVIKIWGWPWSSNMQLAGLQTKPGKGKGLLGIRVKDVFIFLPAVYQPGPHHC